MYPVVQIQMASKEDDLKDNSKKEVKQLMNSCVQKLMNYLDSTCGLSSNVNDQIKMW